MCEFLVLARNGKAFKKDDIIAVNDDGFKWGTKEGPPTFRLVKIPGMSREEGLKYCEPLYQNKDTKVKASKIELLADDRRELSESSRYKIDSRGEIIDKFDGKKVRKLR
jgi:hypothetical protein